MKRPRYYCENCGAEVRRDARVCPRCGRFFSSVKCPRCGFVGKVEDFKAGCPVCGYAEAIGPAPESFKAPPPQVAPLSPWVYVAVLVALAAMIGIFFLKTK